MPVTATCKRHPSVETRLACSSCGDRICPQCAIPSHVGQKCPSCARQAPGARVRGKPRQFAKAAAVGLAGAAAMAFGLALFISTVGWFRIIGSAFAAYGVGRAVRWGAEGNRARPFVAIAICSALVGFQVAWLLLGRIIPLGLDLLGYAAVAYGAWLAFDR